MQFKMIHENFNVTDLDRSLAFYEKALGLREKRRRAAQSVSEYENDLSGAPLLL